MSDPNAPFVRSETVDEPGISGARWWQESMHLPDTSAEEPGRRRALQILVGIGATLAVTGVVAGIAYASQDAWEQQLRPALAMQREYGWAFGAATEGLVFDGTTLRPFDKNDLDTLSNDCAPKHPNLVPFAIPTLFEAPASAPRTTATGDPQSFVKLADLILPIDTPLMNNAYARGEALADLFHSASGQPAAAVIVDLPGPEAVAFAAGASGVLEPVFLFDNWPHPRGVVPAHQTLGALAFYQPLFRKTRVTRPMPALPMFVLDRNRLSSDVDEATQFDNRHLGRLPSATSLTRLGLHRVLYVTPDLGTFDLDDVNDTLHDYVVASFDVRAVAAVDFYLSIDDGSRPAVGAASRAPRLNAYYGPQATTHESFWRDYPWAQPTRGLTAAPGLPPAVRAWRPTLRQTAFSGSLSVPTHPPGFGMMPVVVAIGTGAILGAKLSRSGFLDAKLGGMGGLGWTGRSSPGR